MPLSKKSLLVCELQIYYVIRVKMSYLYVEDDIFFSINHNLLIKLPLEEIIRFLFFHFVTCHDVEPNALDTRDECPI